jgi:hypothetical protein
MQGGRGMSLVAQPAIKRLDAIIAAPAKVNACPVIKRDPKDVVSSGAIVHIPHDDTANLGIVTNVRPRARRSNQPSSTRPEASS